MAVSKVKVREAREARELLEKNSFTPGDRVNLIKLLSRNHQKVYPSVNHGYMSMILLLQFLRVNKWNRVAIELLNQHSLN